MAEGNDTKVVTWPQLSFISAGLGVLLGAAVGAGGGWVNQLENAVRRDLDAVAERVDRNRERVHEDLRALQRVEGRVDRLEQAQSVDPRDLAAIITRLENRLSGLDGKTDRILQRLGESLPGQPRASP